MKKLKKPSQKAVVRTAVAAALVLACALGVAVYALRAGVVSMPDNLFVTGKIAINLNDGQALIQSDELFAPGTTEERTFFVENTGTADLYYRVYFADLEGALADVLEIEVKQGDTVLFSGTPAEFTRKQAAADEQPLTVDERRQLSVTFCWPDGKGIELQAQTLTFTLCADAVQAKNNDDKLFAE